MGTRPKTLVTNHLNSTGPLALADALHACPLVPHRRWFILGTDQAQFLGDSTPSICYKSFYPAFAHRPSPGVRCADATPAAQIWVACRQALFNAVRPPSPHYVLWNAPVIGPPLLWENYHRCLFSFSPPCRHLWMAADGGSPDFTQLVHGVTAHL